MNCPACKLALDGNVVNAAQLIRDELGYYAWYHTENLPERRGRITLVAKSGFFDEAEREEERSAFMVFKVGDKFFKVDGEVSSYGGITFPDAGFGLYEVQAKTRTVTFYDYK